MVWGTIAAGVGENSVQLTIDGGPPNITSQTSNGSAVYNVVYFETPLLTETYHTAVVTNLGSAANGSSEFVLDRFSFETTDLTPLFAPPTSQTTPSSQTQSVPSATASASSAKSSSVKSPLGAIAGGVIGTLVLIIILLLFFLWRRRKPKETTGGTFLKHISALLYSRPDFIFRPYPATSNTLSIDSPVPNNLYCHFNYYNYSKVSTWSTKL